MKIQGVKSFFSSSKYIQILWYYKYTINVLWAVGVGQFAVSVHTWEGPAALLDMEALACPSFRSLPFCSADQLVEKRIKTSV